MSDVEEDALARDLTYAVMRHYGYTSDAIATAEQVHPGKTCGDDCTDEDGESVHPVYDELQWTASLMVDVVVPEVDARLSAHEAQIRDLLEEREELLTVIRRLLMGNHPAGWAPRVLSSDLSVHALAEALTERDAGHEGGAGA